ncbi:hemicentin-1-like [Physella acuta]|uniref:hemicentin-1-like n=1 Tax=Physella acuta TaxID=109671 RepID=UPI0027DC44E3|nr:hemicentin-1-like [Physella acuta]
MGYMSSLWQAVGVLVLISAVSGQAVEWIGRPQGAVVKLGDNVTFVCRLNTDDPNLIWSKDDSNTSILFVKDNRFDAPPRYSIINKYDLVITNVQKADNGYFACRTKDAGIQKASLTVLLPPGPPVITRSDTSSVYNEGTVLNLTCSSSGGNPDPRITWLKNGNITAENSDYKASTVIGGTSSLTISVRLDKSDHQANYSCLVYNDVNVMTKLIDSVVMSVRYSPSIGFQPYSPTYSVKLGKKIEIYCDVDANPVVTSVSWSKDGISLYGNNPRRIISQVSKADNGTYTCFAKNNIGENSGSLELNIQYPPIFNISSTQTVDEGQVIAVKCSMDANPKPYEVTWMKILPDGTAQTRSTSDMLRIDSASPGDAGNYSCRTQSQLRISGESVEFVTAETFTYVYVQYKPGAASIGTVPDTDVGERLDITCTATPTGYPEPTYTWTKDGMTLNQNRQTLTIVSAQLSDNGRYTCTPTNVRGSGRSATVSVNIYERPVITKLPNKEVKIGINEPNLVSLLCEARGYPQPRLLWYRNGQFPALNSQPELFTVITTAKPTSGPSMAVESVLQFKGLARTISTSTGQRTVLQVKDMANYTCRAESDKHSETPETLTQLFINFPPVLEPMPTILAVSRQDSAEFTCKTQAYPEPSVLWMFQGRQLVPNDPGIGIKELSSGLGRMESKLTVMNVTDRSYGAYRCLVRNNLGNISQEIILAKKSPPEQPSNLTNLNTTWDSAMLVWQPGFDGGYDQKFFIQKSGGGEEPKKIEVTPSSSRSFNITKLRPSSTYTFQVVASNELGIGPSSLPITVTTNYLQIPSLPKIPVFVARQRKLSVISPYGNEYCLRVDVKSEKLDWSSINGCMKVMGENLEIAQSGVQAINVSVCLSQRTDVCGVPVSADINSSGSETQLTEEHVIIIACVCGVIIVSLLIVLFCFIFRRRRNAAKTYQGGNQGEPPPYNAVPPNKKPHVYDNQGMDTTDLQLTEQSVEPSAPPSPPVHAIPNSFTNNSYGPLDLPANTYRDYLPADRSYSPTPSREVVIHARPFTASSLDKRLYENKLNHWTDNNKMDGYQQNRDGQGSIPRSPTKDKYIDLQDRGGGGDPMMGGPDGGYNHDPMSGVGNKPKKVIYEVVV